MEEKNLTEKESLAIIAEMIQKTKKRMGLDRGNMLLLWGYVGIAAAILVYVTLKLTDNNMAMLWWALIPLVGLPTQRRMRGNTAKNTKGEAKSYIDALSDRLWLIVWITELVAFATCLGFEILGYKVWVIMFIYSLFAVGSASSAQGLIIRETSLVVGGVAGMAAGLFITCCIVCGVPLDYSWMMPLFIICFALMSILPGHIINRKAKRLCSKS